MWRFRFCGRFDDRYVPESGSRDAVLDRTPPVRVQLGRVDLPCRPNLPRQRGSEPARAVPEPDQNAARVVPRRDDIEVAIEIEIRQREQVKPDLGADRLTGRSHPSVVAAKPDR